MIKDIEDLKDIQIVCRKKEEIEDCFNMLEELGFEVRNNDDQYQVIFYREYSDMFENDARLQCGVVTYYYNKNFIKNLQKLIKEKKEKEKEKKEKEKLPDFEVAKDGRIIKINNWDSDKYVHILTRWIDTMSTFNRLDEEAVKYYVSTGQLFFSEKAREEAIFKMEIETKLKNIAERLNAGKNIDWNDMNQEKFGLYYNFEEEELYLLVVYYRKSQGVIYCLDQKFLEVVKQEIGEENLIKYFKE